MDADRGWSSFLLLGLRIRCAVMCSDAPTEEACEAPDGRPSRTFVVRYGIGPDREAVAPEEARAGVRYACVECGTKLSLKRIKNRFFSHRPGVICSRESRTHKEAIIALVRELKRFAGGHRAIEIHPRCTACQQRFVVHLPQGCTTAVREFAGKDPRYFYDAVLLRGDDPAYVFEVYHTHRVVDPKLGAIPYPWIEIKAEAFLREEPAKQEPLILLPTQGRPDVGWSAGDLRCPNCRDQEKIAEKRKREEKDRSRRYLEKLQNRAVEALRDILVSAGDVQISTIACDACGDIKAKVVPRNKYAGVVYGPSPWDLTVEDRHGRAVLRIAVIVRRDREEPRLGVLDADAPWIHVAAEDIVPDMRLIPTIANRLSDQGVCLSCVAHEEEERRREQEELARRQRQEQEEIRRREAAAAAVRFEEAKKTARIRHEKQVDALTTSFIERIAQMQEPELSKVIDAFETAVAKAKLEGPDPLAVAKAPLFDLDAAAVAKLREHVAQRRTVLRNEARRQVERAYVGREQAARERFQTALASAPTRSHVEAAFTAYQEEWVHIVSDAIRDPRLQAEPGKVYAHRHRQLEEAKVATARRLAEFEAQDRKQRDQEQAARQQVVAALVACWDRYVSAVQRVLQGQAAAGSEIAAETDLRAMVDANRDLAPLWIQGALTATRRLSGQALWRKVLQADERRPR